MEDARLSKVVTIGFSTFLLKTENNSKLKHGAPTLCALLTADRNHVFTFLVNASEPLLQYKKYYTRESDTER